MGRRNEPARRSNFHRGWGVLLVAALTSVGCASSSDDPMEEPHGDGDSDGEQHVTYCDVETIFADKCLRCHSDGGDLSVPFNLGTYDEAQARLSHIKPAVEDGFMPFDAVELDPPVEDLTEEERHMIIDWVDAGGPSGGCE